MQGSNPLHLIRCRDWQSQATVYPLVYGPTICVANSTTPSTAQHGPAHGTILPKGREAMEDTEDKSTVRISSFQPSSLGQHKITSTSSLSLSLSPPSVCLSVSLSVCLSIHLSFSTASSGKSYYFTKTRQDLLRSSTT